MTNVSNMWFEQVLPKLVLTYLFVMLTAAGVGFMTYGGVLGFIGGMGLLFFLGYRGMAHLYTTVAALVGLLGGTSLYWWVSVLIVLPSFLLWVMVALPGAVRLLEKYQEQATNTK